MVSAIKRAARLGPLLIFLTQAPVMVLFTSTGEAATFYMSPQGNNANPGTEASPWATFQRAWQTVRRGDTLILLDGTYYQTLAPSLPAPDPANPQYVTIRAKNDGKAVLDGQGARIPIDILASYVIVEGLVARNGTDAVVKIGGSGNVIVRRVSAYDANPDLNSMVMLVISDNVLLEDVVAAGTGRKMINIFLGGTNTVRRAFAKFDRWDGRQFCAIEWPSGSGIEVYDGANTTIENSISYSGTIDYGIGFKAQNYDTLAANNRLLGNMVIMSGRRPDGTIISDSRWGVSRPTPTTCTAVINPRSSYIWRSGFWIIGPGIIQNNLLQDNLAYGGAGPGLVVEATGTFSGNVLRRFTAFGNGLDNPDGGGGQWGGKNIDVIQADLNQFSAVEDSKIEKVFTSWPNYPSGTKQVTSLTGGGARLRYRYVNGVLMDGTNGQPSQQLWPWPMESRIQAELGISVTNLLSGIVPDQVTPVPTIPPPQAPLNVYIIR